MSGIKTASEAPGPLVAADAIDWKHVDALQLWAMKLGDTAGIRYSLTVIFADETWIRIDITADLDDAIRNIQRVSAEHDIPIRRLGDDERLKAAGY